MRQLKKYPLIMKGIEFTIVILTSIFLQNDVWADIAPNPIEARSISPKRQTSIRMESEVVTIDLYNDSSVVKCLFRMKNLGKQEKLQIGFPEMSFHYYQQKSKMDEAIRFQVKENGKIVSFDFSDSLRYNDVYRKGVESYIIREEWYLWESKFQEGESKVIEVQYSLPFGMLYKSNERFFTYLLSTGADWKGTIGKAEIIINLKDIEQDSIINQKPSNFVISNNQISWSFSDFEPITKDDIKIYYNSNKILYTGKTYVYFLDETLTKLYDLGKLNPNTIVSTVLEKDSEISKNFHGHENGVVRIYTKVYVVSKLEEIIKSRTNKKIRLPDYDKLKERYCLLVNGNEIDLANVIGIDITAITRVKILNSKGTRTQIKIDIKK